MAVVIQMSDRELTRLRVMIDLADDRLTVDTAAMLMGLGRRQIYRLCRAFSADGPAGLASRKRGRPSNRKHGETFRAIVLSFVREHYIDFGPTLAAEKLIERHGLRIGVETLRQWMMADGLWIDRRHKLPSPHQPRRRRECLGELVQIDGSEHRWFEDRGEMCTLLAFVDDATSRLMRLRVCRVRVRIRLLPRDEGLPGDARQASGVLQRQTRHLSRQRQKRDRR
jgi:transposase